MKLKKYDKYKKTQIEWIGEIPEHWNVIKMKYIGDLYSGLSGKSAVDFNQPDNPNNKPYIPFSNILNNEKINPRFLDYVVINKDDNQNIVKKGDLFFLMSSENYDDIGKSSVLESELGETYLNSFCKGFRLSNKSVKPSFLNWLLLSYPNRCRLIIEANGFTRINLKQDKIKEYYVYTPPLSEQIQISFYLDNKTSLIDRLINNNKKLIKLLEEKRTALINKVITKGLDPNVKMKDSGIEWIGEIPEHWEVKRLKFLGQIVGGSTPSSSEEAFWDGDINWITTADMGNTKGKYIYKSKRTITKAGLDSIGNKIFPVGSLIISNRAPIGYVFISQLPSATNQGCKTIYDIKGNVDFMYYYLISIRNILESLGKGTTFKELSDTSLESIKVPFPSQLEQNKIVEYLDKKTSCIDETINKVKDENKLLREYRASLISNVVTGKIKVNNL
ncbi:MAG TPA: restriction endonuclease subunit S [Candidatus Dojkabacteria bacterium]|nr:restriction endonuclease subunit S [Candidatus Dojkabacteria bacterium]